MVDMDRFRSFAINCHLLFFSFWRVIIFSICKCVKVVTSGERQPLNFALLIPVGAALTPLGHQGE